MKKILLSVIIITAVVRGYSQEFSMFDVSWNFSFPMGEQSDFLEDPSFRGFSIGGSKMITPYVAIGGTFSWEIFNKRESGVFGTPDGIVLSGTRLKYFNILPMMVNVKYFLGEDGDTFRPYFGLGVGTIRGRKRTEMGIFVIEDNTWHFGLEPEVGVLMPLGLSGWGANISTKFDYGVKSNNITYSYVGIKLGFSKID